MKRRFLLSIGIVLTLSLTAVGVIQYFLFQAEQFHHIDQQIETTASLLISSDLNSVELKEFEDAQGVVESVVNGDKLNQFVIIFNRKGKMVYRSKIAQIVPNDIPTDQQWQTIVKNGHFIRILTLPLEKNYTSGPHRILQTGIILDADLLRWRSLGRHIVFYSGLIILLVIGITWSLSRTLLRPLVELSLFLKYLGNQFDEKKLVVGGHATMALPRDIQTSKDEFGDLVQAAQSLHSRILQSLKTTQVWTAQMAHELKTPLTILSNCLESFRLAKSDSEKEMAIKDSLNEVAHLNRLISSFLEWTSAENFPVSQSELHALKLKNVVEETATRILRNYPDRIQINAQSSLTLFAQPGFLEQAISNLVVNALKYSSGSVQVILENETLSILDEGAGIPKHVLENLGQPFNYAHKTPHGFGLGLAWVATICRKYEWKLKFENRTEGGFCAQIKFPTSLPE